MQCKECHGDDGKKPAAGGNALFALDPNNYTQTTLFDRVERSMPPAPKYNPSDCVGQCAADVAAYVKTWSSTVALTCDNPDAVTYSPRTLRVLTIDEYKATIEDLLGVPANYKHNIISDNFKGGFPNNGSANVDQNSINKFWNNAWALAAWAVSNNKPASCSGNSDCASEFVENFLPRLFRRPTTEDEMKTYFGFFSEHDGSDGLELAMATALSSPQFLYRSEMGVRVSDVLAGQGFEPVLDVANPSILNIGGQTRTIGLYQHFGQEPNYTFTGDDVVKVRIKGRFADGSWPTMSLKVGGRGLAEETISSSGTRVFNYRVKGLTGRQRISIDNVNKGQHSQSRDLIVNEIVVGNAVMVTPPKPDEDKLKQADPNSYVLDAYEYATAISYVTTGSTPDDALLAAAKDGSLENRSSVLAQVNRLLDTPRGRKRVGDIVAYWFGTDKIVDPGGDRDTTIYPNYTPDVRQSMAEEVRRLFQTIFYDNRRFEEFYSGDFTVVNSTLANYYGINSSSGGANDWQVVDSLDKRGGMLTTGAFMSLHAHPDESAPILRAAHLRRDVLCQHLDSPPLLEDDRERLLEHARTEDAKGTLTTAGYYNIITDSPACDSCHEHRLNPLFGMEDFGPTGLWRSSEKGSTGMTLPIVTDGILYGPHDINDLSVSIPFKGAKSLSKIVADLAGSKACLIDKTFRYITGLPINNNAVDPVTEATLTPKQARDFTCIQERAMSTLDNKNQSPRAVYVELIMQDLMRFRSAKP